MSRFLITSLWPIQDRIFELKDEWEEATKERQIEIYDLLYNEINMSGYLHPAYDLDGITRMILEG